LIVGLVGRARIARALVWRDFLITRSYRLPFVFDLVFGIANLVIYFYISRTFESSETANLGGAPSYFAFAAVGVSLTVVIQAASVGLARRLREEQLTGTFEALVSEPVASAETSLGMAGFPFLFALARACVYLSAAYLLLGLDLSHADFAGLAIMLAVAGVAVAGLGVAFGALVLIFKRGDALAVLVTFALGLGGGAYFPTEQLPSIVQPIVALIPTRFAFDGLRAALFRGEGWGGDALALLLFGIIALPLAVLAFGRALRYARGRGSLAQY
jgi:ABC-2 type transport system permease protein